MFDIKPTLFTGKCFIDLPAVNSTNVYALNLLKQSNIVEGTVVSTFNQTQGKGNANNKWLAEPGNNLSFSIIYKPTFLLAKQQFYLNMAICLGIIEALRKETLNCNDSLKIKWPNDIYYKSFKVGGLLIENTLAGKHLKNSVIGIGINVNQEVFDEALPNPTSLKLITGHKFDLYELMSDVLLHIEKRYLHLKTGNFNALKDNYLDSLYLYKQTAKFRIDGNVVAGTIKGIDENGRLQLEVKDKIKAFGFKEVSFLVK